MVIPGDAAGPGMGDARPAAPARAAARAGRARCGSTSAPASECATSTKRSGATASSPCISTRRLACRDRPWPRLEPVAPAMARPVDGDDAVMREFGAERRQQIGMVGRGAVDQHDGAAALARGLASRDNAGARRRQATKLAARRDRRAPTSAAIHSLRSDQRRDGDSEEDDEQNTDEHMASTPTGRLRLRRGGGRAHASRPSTSTFSESSTAFLIASSCGIDLERLADRRPWRACRRPAGAGSCPAPSSRRNGAARASAPRRCRASSGSGRRPGRARWRAGSSASAQSGLQADDAVEQFDRELESACRACAVWARVISRSAVSEPERAQRRWIRLAMPLASVCVLGGGQALEQPFQRRGRAARRRGAGAAGLSSRSIGGGTRRGAAWRCFAPAPPAPQAKREQASSRAARERS